MTMSYRPLYRAVYARSLLFANEMVNLIAHYIGLSTSPVTINFKEAETYRPLYRAVYILIMRKHINSSKDLLIAHYIGLSTEY